MRRYYFISYLWRTADSPHWIPGEAVTSDEHPLDWANRAWLTYPKTHPGFDLKVVFFTEIAEAVWRRYTTWVT